MPVTNLGIPAYLVQATFYDEKGEGLNCGEHKCSDNRGG